MATPITNTASINFDYGTSTGTAVSNTAQVILSDPVSVSKTTLETTYQRGDAITYILHVSNLGVVPLTNITIKDNLGTYDTNITPLDYDDNALYYVNGTYTSEITGIVSANSVTFIIPSLPAGSNGMILYTATVNSKAPLSAGSSITNTATFTINCSTLTSSATVTATETACVKIYKEMSPNPVYTGGTITYTFLLSNYGNLPATNVVLTDTFNSPLPTITSVRVNGTETSDYTYVGGTLTLPTASSPRSITIPAATYTSASDGTVIIAPGTTVVTVTGIIGTP